MSLIVQRDDAATLIARARTLVTGGGRRLLGIAGPPGAGKSTVAAEVVAALGADAVLVPMDGFHLAQAELERLGRASRKGAPDTFDAAGFVHLVRRLAAADEDVVHAPEFRREIEEPIAGAIAVPREVPLVVVEGNYLLLDAPGWRELRPLLDETWFVAPDESLRRERLIARHRAFGADADAARAHALGSDEANALLVNASAGDADVLIRG